MYKISNDISWKAQWIGRPGVVMQDWRAEVLPAPLYRHEFNLSVVPEQARLRICGLGYYELRLNGDKVGDHVLDPIVTQYDQRVRYVTYDVFDQLQVGANAIGVMLGNGWYNSHTADSWHFDKASWRDYPKLTLELEIVLENGEEITVHSGSEWRVGEGPIRFDGLRNGETYDAREECLGWDMPGYDDVNFKNAVVVPGPGGILQEQTSPACKVMATITPVSVNEIRPGVAVFDLGQNIAGWIELRLSGAKSGNEVTLRYGEKLQDNGEVDQANISGLITDDRCQADVYIAKGEDFEVWEPRFTYHGFQYVQVEGLPEAPVLDNICGRIVHTDFEKIGNLESSDHDLNRLQECTMWSYIGNFVGIPTDCPHREKNGWTGDAQLATETGLMNYDASSSYRQWLESMADTQRPSGQFPGIVPSSGWGYNWGSGPAWDSAFTLIPWYIYLYTGDLTAIEQHYDGFRRYMDFCADMATDYILEFGLGDWCPVDKSTMTSAALTSTAYYYVNAKLLATFAKLTGHDEDITVYNDLADKIKYAFNARFYKGDGIYAEGQMTALGCALYQNLVDDDQQDMVVHKLVGAVNNNNCMVDFGILGAKYVPRALADNGFADLAYRMIMQPEFPGWINGLRQGATTLWEEWEGLSSRNHIMFGDISAWMYNYLAGIKPDPENPGFKHVIIQPHFVPELDWVRASHRSPHGMIASSWQRNAETVEVEVQIPPEVTASLTLAGKEPEILSAGEYKFTM